LINPKGINARLILSLSTYVLVTSAAIVEEVAEVLARPGVLHDTAIRKLDVERVPDVCARRSARGTLSSAWWHRDE